MIIATLLKPGDRVEWTPIDPRNRTFSGILVEAINNGAGGEGWHVLADERRLGMVRVWGEDGNIELLVAKSQAKTRLKALKQAVSAFYAPTYFKHIPLDEVREIVESHGYDTSQMDDRLAWGDSGSVTFRLADDIGLVFSWYRLGSGRWEITGYVS